MSTNQKEIELEVVEFYPNKHDKIKDFLSGTLHVYLISHDIDIRGIYVRKKGKHWFFGMPYAWGTDPDTKQKVKFPVFTFTNRRMTEQVQKLSIELGRKYIEEKYLKGIKR